MWQTTKAPQLYGKTKIYLILRKLLRFLLPLSAFFFLWKLAIVLVALIMCRSMKIYSNLFSLLRPISWLKALLSWLQFGDSLWLEWFNEFRCNFVPAFSSMLLNENPVWRKATKRIYLSWSHGTHVIQT